MTGMRLPRYAAPCALLVLLALGSAGLAACGTTASPGGPASTTSTPGGTSTTAPPATETSPPATVPGPSTSGRPVTVTGVPEAGVEAGCLLLRPYLLVGGDDATRALLASGRQVTVTGHLDPTQMSYCQQGTILVVDSATPSGPGTVTGKVPGTPTTPPVP